MPNVRYKIIGEGVKKFADSPEDSGKWTHTHFIYKNHIEFIKNNMFLDREMIDSRKTQRYICVCHGGKPTKN